MDRKNPSKSIIIAVVLLNLVIVYGFSDPLNSDVSYKINWPGEIQLNPQESQEYLEQYPITTADNEKYICTIPIAKKVEEKKNEPYTGLNPIELLSPLFHQNTCSFKLESYWTYEVCHGKHVKQYHEEREGKKMKLQEYWLGFFSEDQQDKLSSYYDELAKNPERNNDLPKTKKLDGLPMPYVEIKMTNGTPCDLINKPRTIKLLYVCHQQGKHEIWSFEETSSCEYEAVILSPLICSHPDYGPRGTGEDEINCIPVDKAPKKPRALAALEAESIKLRHQKVMEEKRQKVYAIFHVDKESKDGEPRVRVEIHQADALDQKDNQPMIPELENSDQTVSDFSPVKSFLSGKHCLHGGHGWWKYEFCYAHSVLQYHVEKDGSKTVIDLGKFDKQKHIEWIKENPHKRPKPLDVRKQVSHFYSGGTACDKSGKLRQTEVRLVCVEQHASSLSSVALSLHEPKTCEYVLNVESALICEMLELVDNNGLVNDEAVVNFDSFKSESSTQFPDNSDSLENKKTEL